MMAALEQKEGDPNHKSDLVKASNKLGKTISEALIRQFIGDLVQKNCADQ